ncbi:MAG TPA: amino acid-binding ACT [Gemmataceae bacterium]
MGFKMHRVHVWSAELPDQPGAIASKLAMLAETGTNLEYVFTEKPADRPGTGVLYVAPITKPEEVRAARAAGFREIQLPVVMRLEGDNHAGLAHRLTQEWAKAGINLHGTSLAVLGDRFVGYVTFDSAQDANRAATILAELGMTQPEPGSR